MLGPAQQLLNYPHRSVHLGAGMSSVNLLLTSLFSVVPDLTTKASSDR